jgi:hypothetical protein
MAFLETLKAAATVIVEAVKANPLAAGAIVVGTGATIGGGVYAHRRYKARKALAIDVPAVVDAALAGSVTDLSAIADTMNAAAAAAQA